MREFQYLINPKWSEFSYEQLKVIFRQNFDFIEQVSDNTFTPLEETDADPLVGVRGKYMISFLPSETFPHPTARAIARGGLIYNSDKVKHLSLSELRGIGLHEISHNMGLPHTDYTHSIMTDNLFISPNHRWLFWRHDLLKFHEIAPKTTEPVGFISIDEDLRIMIPAVTKDGKQWSAVLRHLTAMTWIIDRSYFADDGITMQEKASLSENGELHLEDVNYLGSIFTLLRFEITPDLKFILIP